MSRLLVTGLYAVAALVVAAALAWMVQRRDLPRVSAAGYERAVGVFHVHSDQSHDSDLALADIVAAAERNALDFVVLTDHNQQYAGPLVREGVTLLSSAELSTPFGHLIQLGADRVLPEEARSGLDVHARVKERGGSPIIAHPGDVKRPWDGPLEGVAGLEIANLSASARRAGGPAFLGLLPVLAALPLNPRLAVAQLYDRDLRALARWDGELHPSVGGFCGADAHGWIDLTLNLAAWKVELAGPMPPTEDERVRFVEESLRGGRFACVAGLFGPMSLHFSARRGDQEIGGPGATVAGEAVDALLATVTVPEGARVSLVLFRNGEAIHKHDGAELEYPTPAPGSYRVEVWLEVPGLLFGDYVAAIGYTNRIRLSGKAPAATAESVTP
jgi:hypothetical protein